MTKEQFIRHLKNYRHLIPKQTLKTLRGQALSGDVDGANRGLAHILKNESAAVPPSA